nr:integrase, catalytic region, zinc finger, CCHC-type, peptidase aspartic, catalytic [Tanacetum cinerariifolium]
MGKGLFGSNSERGRKIEVRFDNFGGGGEEIRNCGGSGGRGSSIFERGRGSLALCSMKSNNGLGGGGLVVVDGSSNTRPPMLDRTDFASWKQCIRLYSQGKENGVNILKSIDEGPFQMGTRDSNYDQLYAYPKQHEALANEEKMMLDRFTQHTVDPIALMSNVSHPQHYSPSSSSTPPSIYVPPHHADNDHLDLGISPIDNLIENLINTLALLTQSYKTFLPHTNNQLRTSSNTRNQVTVHDGRVEAPTAQTMFMANLSSADPVYNEARPSYGLDILSEVHDHDHYHVAICEHHEEHVMHDNVQLNHVVDSHADYTSDSNMIPYDQYVQDNAVPVVHSNENFEGIQKALTREIKEIKDVFKELEAKVAQNLVDRKLDEIEWKNLLIANDNLIPECLTKEVFSVAMNYELNVARFTEMHVVNTIVETRCLELKAENSNLRDKSHNDNHEKSVKHFSNHEQISHLQETRSEVDRTLDFRALDSRITQLTVKVTALQAQNDLFRVENDKIKQHYKELYNSIKITRAKHIEQVTALTTENVNLKAQILNTVNSVSKDHVKPKVLTQGKYAIDIEPIVPHLRNNREAHLDYLRHLRESVEIIRNIVEEAKIVRPLDSSIVYACRYTKHSQELLGYVIGTCPQDSHQRDKNMLLL